MATVPFPGIQAGGFVQRHWAMTALQYPLGSASLADLVDGKPSGTSAKTQRKRDKDGASPRCCHRRLCCHSKVGESRCKEGREPGALAQEWLHLVP